MIEVEKDAKQSIKPRFPAAYYAGCDDVEERRRKLVEAISRERTPESDAAIEAIAKAYGIGR